MYITEECVKKVKKKNKNKKKCSKKCVKLDVIASVKEEKKSNECEIKSKESNRNLCEDKMKRKSKKDKKVTWKEDLCSKDSEENSCDPNKRCFTADELDYIENNEVRGETEPDTELEERLYPLNKTKRDDFYINLSKNFIAEQLGLTIKEVDELNNVEDMWSEEDWLTWFHQEVNKKFGEKVKSEDPYTENVEMINDDNKLIKNNGDRVKEVNNDSNVCVMKESNCTTVVNDGQDTTVVKGHDDNDQSLETTSTEEVTMTTVEEKVTEGMKECFISQEEVIVGCSKANSSSDTYTAIASEKFVSVRVPGEVDGRSLPMIVDTGAGTSMISLSLWEQLGRPQLEEVTSSLKWNSASGHTLNIHGEVCLSLKVGEKSVYFEFIVVEELCFDIILGVDILFELKAMIDIAREILVFKDTRSEVPIQLRVKVRPEGSVVVKLKSTLGVDPGCRRMVVGVIDEKLPVFKTAMIEKLKYSHQGELVANSICTMQQHQVLIEVYNPNFQKIYLKRGSGIAKATFIPEEVLEKLSDEEIEPVSAAEGVTVSSKCEFDNDKRVFERDEVIKSDIISEDDDVKRFNGSQNRDKQEKIKYDSQNANTIATIHKSEKENEELEINFEKSSLNEKQRKILQKELNNFRDIFVKTSKAPGRTSLLQFHINTGDSPPIKAHPYRVTQKESEEMEKEINQYLELGLIRESQSPWSSPVLMVRKPDGSIRFCIDYRKLNSVTIKDSYPMPRIDELLDVLGRAKLFSSMDIASGYWNVPMAEESISKTAFTTKFGLFEWLVMPFGLTNAPAGFQKLMDSVLINVKWKICLVYLDDCVIFSEDFTTHLLRIREVLSRFREAGFKLKMSKCHWGRTSIPFLGHLITTQGILPNPAKISVVMNAKRPKDVSSLRSFTGLTSYFRRFVKGYSKVAAPLESLKQKDRVWKWTDECEEAFKLLKRKLVSPPILAYPDWNLPFILHTDASMNAIGAVLLQKQDGRERVIAYAGRVTNKQEKNYGITELECLAIVYGVKKFRCYLDGRKFELITDHSALTWLFKSNSKTNNRKLMRWVLELQSYDFVVKYRPGNQHGSADGISRLVYENQTEGCGPIRLRSNKEIPSGEEKVINNIEKTKASEEPEVLLEVNNIKRIREEQRKCSWMLPMILFLDEGVMPLDRSQVNFINRNVHLYKLSKEGVLMRSIKYTRKLRSDNKIEKFVVVIPYDMCEEVMEQCHKEVLAGHLGRTKTWERIRERCYWPGMYKDVVNYVDSCEECGSKKGNRLFSVGKRQNMPVELLLKPFSFIVVDAIGPLPITKDKKQYIITVVDYVTRFAEAFAVKDLKTSTWLKVLEDKIVSRYGVPINLLSDQGSNFVSDLAKDFYKTMGIHKMAGTAYHPETQGLVERFNGTLIRLIKMFVEENQKNWDVYLPRLLFAYRTAYHETLGDSPFYLLYGYDPTLPLDLSFMEGKVTVTDTNLCGRRRKLIRELIKVRNQVAEVMMEAQLKVDRLQEKRKAVQYEIGEPVWLYCYFRKLKDIGDDRVSKLATKWHGPYRVLEKMSDNVYKLKVPTHPKKEVTVNVNRLKRYKGFWSKPFENERVDEEIQDVGESESLTIDDLPENSFMNEIQFEDEEKVLSNVPRVVKRIVAKREVDHSKGKKVQYLLLTCDGEYRWKFSDELAYYKDLVEEYEQQARRWEKKTKLRRSKRVKEANLEAGQVQVYFD